MRKIEFLIKKWINLTPQRNLEVFKILKDSGIDEKTIEAELQIKISKPQKLDALPTFSEHKKRDLSPMLSERFSFAGTIKDGTETWLSQKDMTRAVISKKNLKTLESLHKNWEGSVPQKYSADQVGIFSIQPDQPENITLLVWTDSSIEPMLVRYNGQNESKFLNLEKFLEWAVMK
jgi:hypothetical protein